jgi:hypothetical protein
VANRDETVKFFVGAFGYKFQAEFEIFFNDEKTDKALCIALEPPEKTVTVPGNFFTLNWSDAGALPKGHTGDDQIYHLAPEIFVSEGTPGSIVWDWVQRRDGIGGIHHLAYQVDSVKGKMAEWTEKGYGDFTSQDVMTCPGLKQVFSKPHRLTGVIFEFIERDGFGFCENNVKSLMISTANLDSRMP